MVFRKILHDSNLCRKNTPKPLEAWAKSCWFHTCTFRVRFRINTFAEKEETWDYLLLSVSMSWQNLFEPLRSVDNFLVRQFFHQLRSDQLVHKQLGVTVVDFLQGIFYRHGFTGGQGGGGTPNFHTGGWWTQNPSWNDTWATKKTPALLSIESWLFNDRILIRIHYNPYI